LTYTRKELDRMARDILKAQKRSLPPAYRHCPKLAGWTLIINESRITLAVQIDDHAGRREHHVAI